MKNDIIYLITQTEEKDSDGFSQVTETKHEVFADIKSSKGVEFYQSNSAGFKVTEVATVNYFDYMAVADEGRPDYVEYEGIKYRIVRRYRVKKNDSIDLSLQEVE